eukprot:CAMPEP_0172621718 /NCGR_PEP_ID=MMETSP1068-20121228/114633_1 /TAXON_ID=35684 /ORGANISM="Pseudopedinella elastica, Strain CCMP716" /LENGTH=281 /DNA_ID=CAMNT_0013429585 /DNA_START=187 /DNA_END=1032 /DNA_ORIENTATION=+
MTRRSFTPEGARTLKGFSAPEAKDPSEDGLLSKPRVGPKPPQGATYFEGRRVLKELSPLERWLKLMKLMAPSKGHPYGMSTNAMASELDIPLRVIQDFINSGGAPSKYEASSGYRTEPLRTLADWVDTQMDSKPKEKSAADAESVDTETTRDDFQTDSEAKSDLPEPTPAISAFLEELGGSYVKNGPLLAKLGVERPGELLDFELGGLVAGGVRKLQARRMLAHPHVLDDANAMAKEQGKDQEGGEDTKVALFQLLAQAEAMGLTGMELDAARAAILASNK